MTKSEYRIRKVANDYRRDLRKRGIIISVARAYKETEAMEKIFAALGPLTERSRHKVCRMLLTALE